MLDTKDLEYWTVTYEEICVFWDMQTVADFSPRRFRFDHRPVHVRFVMDKVALRQVFPQYFRFPCQYHSTNAPHSFIHLPPTLYNVSLQYFSFPCQYHSTNAPYSFTHLPPTLYNVSLPVLQFPLSIIPPMLHTHIPINVALTIRTNGRSLGFFQRAFLGSTV
jgi:hypothetical protein